MTGMVLAGLWSLSAMAAPQVSTVVGLAEGSGACADDHQTHVAVLPLVLEAPALVFAKVSSWDRAQVQVGLSDGVALAVCHGISHQEDRGTEGSPGVDEDPARVDLDVHSIALWLPAGAHRVELVASEETSAVLEVTAMGVADLQAMGMRRELAEAALMAADHGWTERQARRSSLAVIDFSLPSTEERVWLVDLDGGELRHHLLLTHGKGSGHHSNEQRAVRFSNRPFSNQSSLGLFVASETYIGSNGRSMRLDGLEPRVNDLARERLIVFHGAEYARMDHIAEWGYLGRSHGCPAVDDRVAQTIIDALYGGGLLYAWYPDSGFFEASEVLR